MVGSSPLARGRLDRATGEPFLTGIIPARAGSTISPRWSPGHWRDHPRSRGVDALTRSRLLDPPGSSPLARGRPKEAFEVQVTPGIIPARAGSTYPRPVSTERGGDHPRSRGVDFVKPTSRGGSGGSSPLARGRPNNLVQGTARDRDHPRSRGVDGPAVGYRGDPGGSSPLARGRLRDGAADHGERGIIPARAGSTGRPRRTGSPAGDHPRSRGVDAIVGAAVEAPDGSSPLARGRLRLGNSHDAPGGIIPARAGSTISSKRLRRASRDHPRSRGVDHNRDRIFFGATGSSPLARGRRKPAEAEPQLAWIIPARAGSTAMTGCPTIACRDHPRSRGVDEDDILLLGFLVGSSPLARGRLRYVAKA